jgi:DinB superfamily
MAETAEQYIARILSNAEGQDGLTVLAATAGRLKALVASTPRGRWMRRPAPDRWSAGEVLAHLADAEVVTGWRIRSILARDGVPLQPFDQDVWAIAFKYGEVDPEESLELFSAARASLLSLLKRVDPERREHHGLHAERGRETIAHLIRLYAGHDLNHLKQIEGLVGA